MTAVIAERCEWTAAELAALPECTPDRLPLGDWYARPLVPGEADAVAEAARRALRAAWCERRETMSVRLSALIAAFWLGRAVRDDYLSLRASLHGSRMAALLELVYGQLLASRRMCGAHAHLCAGFEAAVPWFGAAEYFRVLRRHRLLEALVPGDGPCRAQNLRELLREAQVIHRLGGGARVRHSTREARADTVG